MDKIRSNTWTSSSNYKSFTKSIREVDSLKSRIYNLEQNDPTSKNLAVRGFTGSSWTNYKAIVNLI